MEQGQEVRDPEQVEVWEGVKVVAAVAEVVLWQAPVDTASARTVEKECLTN